MIINDLKKELYIYIIINLIINIYLIKLKKIYY